MPPKASNIERQAWNSKCRSLLAKHIFDERLGVVVEDSKLEAENQCLRTQVQEILGERDQLRCSLQEMEDSARREKQAEADTAVKLEAANVECEVLRNQLQQTKKQLELLEAMVSRHRSAFAQILDVTGGIVNKSPAFTS
ncbi:uncharacterized protein CLUP02_08031 [Colletotrichum lupini]|uniref:Uncharacterized protein n=1 Tax=Colletotrichum lupini TaxID=145971 RepID=A0A9Q8SSB3_9PEZI|nr:uncharacterized protein CLUP02_08031 [Colletotrichum lupini]UQC82543.1 hypothetical protein CLUP02_08031 [Colletotrichum lupini]